MGLATRILTDTAASYSQANENKSTLHFKFCLTLKLVIDYC